MTRAGVRVGGTHPRGGKRARYRGAASGTRLAGDDDQPSVQVSVEHGSVAARVDGTTHHLVVRGPVDREAARQIDFLIRHGMWEPQARVIIDITQVEEVSGALVGALLRASRRLAWRNRRLTIWAPRAAVRQRLEMAGLDELAEVVAVPPASA
jgi:anti-anti-sigma factor